MKRNSILTTLFLALFSSGSLALTVPQATAFPRTPSSLSSEIDLPLNDGKHQNNSGKSLRLLISYNGDHDICAGYLLNKNWMITAAHCFAAGFPLESYTVSGEAGRGAIEDIFFKRNIDVALAKLSNEFPVTECTPLPPVPTEKGKEVTVYTQLEEKKLPFNVRTNDHIASNPIINIDAHPMLSLSPAATGRLTQAGESGAPVFSRGKEGTRYLIGIISGVSTQQEISLAEDLYRHQDFIHSHAGKCVPQENSE